MRQVLTLLMALLVSGSALAESRIEKVRTLPEPRDGEALLVFVRPGSLGAMAQEVFIFLDGEFHSVLKNDSWSYAFVPTGLHRIELGAGLNKVTYDHRVDLFVEAEAGRTSGFEFRIGRTPRAIPNDEAAKLVATTEGISHASEKQAASARRLAEAMRTLRAVEWSKNVDDAGKYLQERVRRSVTPPAEGWRPWITSMIRKGVPTREGQKEKHWVRPRRETLGETYLLGMGLFAVAMKESAGMGWLEAAEILDKAAIGLDELRTMAAGKSDDLTEDRKTHKMVKVGAARSTGFTPSNQPFSLVGMGLDALWKAGYRAKIGAEAERCQLHAAAARQAAECSQSLAPHPSMQACLDDAIRQVASASPEKPRDSSR